MAKRDYFINLDAEVPSQALVISYAEAAQASAPVFYRDETYACRFHFLRSNPNTTSSRPFVYVPTSGISTLKVAAGIVDAAPTGGTFTLTGGAGGTTSALAYNASAATVQTAVRASLTGFTAATVIGNAGGPYTIDYGTTGAQTDITGTATSLTPDGSTVVIVNTQNGSATLDEKWQVKLVKAYPLLRTSGWTAPNTVSVAAAIIQSGSDTANKVYSLTWNTDAYDGNVWVAVTAATGTAQTVGPIPYNANPDEMIAIFAQHSVLISTDVAITKSGAGSYEVTFQGTQAISNTPAIATASNNLKIPDYFQGTLSAATAGVDDILAGATSATVTFEVELEEAASQPVTACVRDDASFYADLIRNNPGQSTGTENFPTDLEVVNFNNITVAYIGGAATALDAIVTTTKTAGYYLEFVHTTDGPRAYQLTAGTSAESSPDIIRPDDYNASTNAKVWLSRR